MCANHLRARKVSATVHPDRGTWTIRGRVFDPETQSFRQRTRTTRLKVRDHTKEEAEQIMRDMVAQWEMEIGDIPVYDPIYGSAPHVEITREIPGIAEPVVLTLTGEEICRVYHAIKNLKKPEITHIKEQRQEPEPDKLGLLKDCPDIVSLDELLKIL